MTYLRMCRGASASAMVTAGPLQWHQKLSGDKHLWHQGRKHRKIRKPQATTANSSLQTERCNHEQIQCNAMTVYTIKSNFLFLIKDGVSIAHYLRRHILKPVSSCDTHTLVTHQSSIFVTLSNLFDKKINNTSMPFRMGHSVDLFSKSFLTIFL